MFKFAHKIILRCISTGPIRILDPPLQSAFVVARLLPRRSHATAGSVRQPLNDAPHLSSLELDWIGRGPDAQSFITRMAAGIAGAGRMRGRVAHQILSG